MSLASRTAALATAVSLAVAVSGCQALGIGVERSLGELRKPAVIKEDNPFEGSPAEKFGNGADAIVIPRARRVGQFSARDVAYAYRVTKKILMAAYLDRRTLMAGHPAAYARALDPEQREIFLKLLDHEDQEKNSRSWVVSFAKGEAELVGDVIKVKGSMSARQGKDEEGNPELWIVYSFRFVYAVRKPGTDKITRVMAYDKARTEFWRDSPGARLRHWVGDSTEAWYAGVQCKWDGFLHPLYPGEKDTGAPATGPTMDPFSDDRSNTTSDSECQNVGDV